MITKYYSIAFTTITFLLMNLLSGQEKTNVLVLFHSDQGGTYTLAKEIAKGIEKNGTTKATIKQVQPSNHILLKNVPVAHVDELPNYDGIAFGSPVYFGNISTPMSQFLSKTVDLWTNHLLENLPATVFMSAGSGAGNELAVQAFWNTLAVHGMVLVSNGIRGMENVDTTKPQGNTVLGTTSLASLKNSPRPSESERYLAQIQGENFAQIATALKSTRLKKNIQTSAPALIDIDKEIQAKGIILPQVPQPAGNYKPYIRSGNLIFINQVALKDGKIQYPGKIGTTVSEKQAQEATKTTMLNVLAVLKDAVGGDLNRVVQCVQLTGIFNTTDQYTQHALLMNEASNLTVDVFGEKGKHARATFGANSIPVNSAVEIQAIFEVN